MSAKIQLSFGVRQYAIADGCTCVARVQSIPTLKLLFWQLAFGSMVFLFMFAIGTPFTPVPCASDWVNLAALAALPTVVSLGCTTVAIHCIGSTSTAIFGALEPVTAVALSILTLNQTITPRELWGGLLIVIATTMVVCSDRIDPVLLRVRKMFPRHPRS